MAWRRYGLSRARLSIRSTFRPNIFASDPRYPEARGQRDEKHGTTISGKMRVANGSLLVQDQLFKAIDAGLEGR